MDWISRLFKIFVKNFVKLKQKFSFENYFSFFAHFFSSSILFEKPSLRTDFQELNEWKKLLRRLGICKIDNFLTFKEKPSSYL